MTLHLLKYLYSSAAFEKPNEGAEDTRTDAQKERDAIAVSESTSKNPPETPENEENEEEQEEENEEEEEHEENEEQEKDLNEPNKEKKEETDEEKETRLAAEKAQRKADRQQRKWDKLAAEKTAAEAKVKELEAKLKENPVEGLTEEEVERRAEAKAELKLAERNQQNAQKEFEKTIDKLEADAIKVDTNFPKALSSLVEEIGMVPGEIINVLADLDNENGGEVLSYLANNVDEAEDIYELKKNPSRLALKLVRISDKLKEAKKAPRKERSRVPEPIIPVSEGGDKQNSPLTGKEDMETWVAKRNRQAEAHQKRKMGM
jgi:hypothetical protein